jgi:hypothetical protein
MQCLDARTSVSHVPIPPPLWLQLESDPDVVIFDCSKDYPLTDFAIIGDTFRCVNGHEIIIQAHHLNIMQTIDTILYTTTSAMEFQLPVIPCGGCADSRGETFYCCGPDLGKLGIFNYNNYSVFTHELMNECLSCKHTTGEPLHSFCVITNRTYLENGSHFEFCGKSTFSVVSLV